LKKQIPEPSVISLLSFEILQSVVGARFFYVSSGANVRAEKGRVNTIRIVQRWNSRPRIQGKNQAQGWVEERAQLAHEQRGLRGGQGTGLDGNGLAGRNLHTGCTG
jgi:hypothetical protein